MIHAEDEDLRLIQEWNQTEKEYPQKTIHQLFEEQVQKTPDNIAVIFEDQQLTYQELNKKSNQLAHYLRELGVKSNTLVAICLDRSFEMIISLLGILKAGGAYVPLDPEYPKSRLQFMLDDTEAKIVLTHSKFYEKFESADRTIIHLDNQNWPEKIYQESKNNPINFNTLSDLICVIYTSGSTGKPNGVMSEHRALCNRLLWMQEAFDLTRADRVLQKTPFTFDVSVWEFFWPIITGASLVFSKSEEHKNPSYLDQVIIKQKITVIHFVPSMMREFLERTTLEESHHLRLVVCSGEVLSVALKRQFLQKFQDISLYNLYGPTEAAIDVTFWECFSDSDRKAIPIGQPIANTQIYILNDQKQMLPIGETGEIYIGGMGLARGYINQPELTQEKFIPNPFSKAPDSRLYKTGDLGRWLADGNLEFLGRIDHQVKIRGFRVELEEIEHHLNQYPNIENAIVIAKKQSNSDDLCLAAYLYFLEDDIDLKGLLSYLKSLLPYYMVPSVFFKLDQVPITLNGKVDRKILERGVFDKEMIKDEKYSIAKTIVEKKLLVTWSEILGLREETIGIYDDFFYLGGHSLVAIQLISRILKDYGLALSIQEIFNYSTIFALAKRIEEKQKRYLSLNSNISSTQINLFPLSYAQEQIWLQEKMVSGTSLFNEVMNITMLHNVNKNVLEQALNYIITRHAIFHVRFLEKNNDIYQQPVPYRLARLDFLDVRGKPLSTRLQLAMKAATEHAKPPFNLQKDFLARFLLIQLEDKKFQLFITIHHLLIDAVSMFCIFKRELEYVYQQLIRKRPVALPALSVRYIDYALWNRLENPEKMESDLQYWKQKLENLPELLIPKVRSQKSYTDFKGKRKCFSFSKELTKRLKQIAIREEATYFMILLATFDILLGIYTGKDDIAVGSVFSKREHPATERLIGNFLNTLILRNDLSGNLSFREFLKRVKNTSLEAYDHSFVPFNRVVEELHLGNKKYQPIQVAFILEPKQYTGELGWKMSQLEIHLNEVKFDLIFELDEIDDQIIGRASFNSNLFDLDYMDRMIKHFECLLIQVVENINKKISQFQLGNDLKRADNIASSYVTSLTPMHLLFENQVTKTPNEVAVVDATQSLTYDELNKKANLLANSLINLGIQKNDLVAIYLDHTVEILIAILAVLKSGAGYLPLDISEPSERLNFKLKDSRPKLLITQSNFRERFNKYKGSLICLDQFHDERKGESKLLQNPRLKEYFSNDLAYVIYTSGTTNGMPKGVAIDHKNLSNYIKWQLEKMPFLFSSQVDCSSSFCFDFSISISFSVLCNGSTIVLCPMNVKKDPEKFLRHLIEYKINYLKLTPTYFRVLKDALSAKFDLTNIKAIVLGGEAVDKKDIQDWLRFYPNHCFYNHYGPTETTVGAVYTKLDLNSIRNYPTIPIGKPIANTQVYVLDQYMHPLPVYIPGELYIGGAGVARGYLNRPELTKEKFIPNPFSDDPKSRLYKTGDLVRWLPDGNLEFLGRMDHQVKIRGFRVELEEVEQTLLKHEQVVQAAVIYRNEVEPALAAYLVIKDVDEAEFLTQLRKFLKERLPDYMIPSSFAILEKMPLLANGKLDRKALCNIRGGMNLLAVKYIAPKTKIQKQLRRIWSKYLKIRRIGIKNDFFELGGHSILAIKVIMAMNHKFKMDLPVCEIFHNSTIEELAEIVKN